MKLNVLFLIALYGVINSQQARAINYAYKRIDIPGASYTHADSINSKGEIAGGFSYNESGSNAHGFIYLNGKYRIFDIKNASSPNRVSIHASSINDHGQVTGYHSTVRGDDYHSFFYQGGKYAKSFDVPGFIGSQAYGISANGYIAGTYFLSFYNRRAYLFCGGKFMKLDVPGLAGNRNDFIQSIAMNEKGTVAGTFSSGESFIYKNGRINKLTIPKNPLLHLSINSLEQIVGSYPIGSVYRGFLYSGGRLKTIYLAGAKDVIPAEINNRGQIIGQYSDAAGWHSFLYSAGRKTLLKFPGSKHTDLIDINDKGQLIGQYVDSFSKSHAFVANPIP